MKAKWPYIKILFMIICFVFLASFSYNRHNKKKVKSIKVHYHQSKQIFISKQSVNKLLIQNNQEVKNMIVENLDLNLIEKQIEANPMVEKAEVFLDLDKTLHTLIKQRRPLARVITEEQYYIDTNGKKMPLSEHFTATVPVIWGLKNENIKVAHQLIQHIQKDLFLKNNLTQIKAYPNAKFEIRLRNLNFIIFIGEIENLAQKFINLKAFLVKAKKDKLLEKYNRIDLQYGNQVVCEKFEV